MANYNKVILLGNLTRDPVLKYLQSGSAVVEIGLAVNRTWYDQGSGQKREATTFVECRAFGKQAETINQYMKKGRQILIEGRLDYHTWEKDGQKRSKLDVFIETFQFVGSGRREEGEGGQDAPPRSMGAQRGPARGAESGGPGRAAYDEAPAPSFEGVAENNTVDEDVPF